MIDVSNENVKQLTDKMLSVSIDEDKVVSGAVEHVYAAMITLAVCGYVGDYLDLLLEGAHKNIKPIYEALRKALMEDTSFDA